MNNAFKYNRGFSPIIFLLSFFMTILVTVSSSYVYISSINNAVRPYGLSAEYTCYFKDSPSDLKINDLVNPNSKDLIIVNIDSTKREAGLFDPNKRYLFELEETNNRGRYLEKEDYLKARPVNLKLKDNDLVYLDDDNEFYYISPQVCLYDKKLDRFINLFSQQTFKDKIYLDGTNENARTNIDKALVENKYTKEKSNNSFLHVVLKNNTLLSKEGFILMFSTASYFLCLISISRYYRLQINDIELRLLYSDSIENIEKEYRKTLLISAISGAIFAMIISISLIYTQEFVLKFEMMYKLFLGILVIHMLIFIASFKAVWTRLDLKKVSIS